MKHSALRKAFLCLAADQQNLLFNVQPTKKSCLPNLLPVFLTPNWLVAVLIAGFVLEVVGRFRVVFVGIESREFLFCESKG